MADKQDKVSEAKPKDTKSLTPTRLVQHKQGGKVWVMVVDEFAPDWVDGVALEEIKRRAHHELIDRPLFKQWREEYKQARERLNNATEAATDFTAYMVKGMSPQFETYGTIAASKTTVLKIPFLNPREKQLVMTLRYKMPKEVRQEYQEADTALTDLVARKPVSTYDVSNPPHNLIGEKTK